MLYTTRGIGYPTQSFQKKTEYSLEPLKARDPECYIAPKISAVISPLGARFDDYEVMNGMSSSSTIVILFNSTLIIVRPPKKLKPLMNFYG